MAKNWKNVCKKIFNKGQGLEQEQQDFHSTYRLLLLGTKESGKTTIMKQMRILYGSGFTTILSVIWGVNANVNDKIDDKFFKKSCSGKLFSAASASFFYCFCERLAFVPDIRRNVKTAISQLVKAFVTLDSMRILDCADNQEHLDYICNMNGFLLTDEGLELYAGNSNYKEDDAQYSEEFWRAVESLWEDAEFQKLYSRRNEFVLLDCAKYFLERISEIKQPNYIPSEQDVLRVRIESSKSMDTSFTVDGVRYNMFDVAGQRDQRGKWLQCFNNINAIIFVVPTSGYDLPPVNQDGSHNNRLSESFSTFSMLWNSKWLTRKSVIVFLNKVDQLQEKISTDRSKFEAALPDFCTYLIPSFAISSPGESTDFIRAKYFIRNELTKITSASNTQHVCYPHFTSAIYTENLEKAFNDCREIIQRTQLLQINAL